MNNDIREYIPETLKRIVRKRKEKLKYFMKQFFQQKDIFIISFPKSGRTWLRLLIGKYLCEKYNYPEKLAIYVPLLTKNHGLSSTYFFHDKSNLKELRYNELSRNKRRFSRKKVVFLARDIKDTLVSYYFHTKVRDKGFVGSISEFIRNEYFGVKKIINFFNIWYINRTTPKEFLFIRYENLHEDPHNVLAQVLNFIGLRDVEEDIIKSSINFANFGNMKRMEKNDYFFSHRLRPRDVNDNDTYKVRKGIIAGYKDYLNEKDIIYIDKIIKEMGCPFETQPNFRRIKLFRNQ